MLYDKMCDSLGGHGDYVTKPEDNRPALERGGAKVDEGLVALINVRADYRPRDGGVRFSGYST
jgi:thiamine pyrophosphate-dependent acetolactate synthase large subunit-like protein